MLKFGLEKVTHKVTRITATTTKKICWIRFLTIIFIFYLLPASLIAISLLYYH